MGLLNCIFNPHFFENFVQLSARFYVANLTLGQTLDLHYFLAVSHPPNSLTGRAVEFWFPDSKIIVVNPASNRWDRFIELKDSGIHRRVG
jgi:hypothetical protein